MPLFCPNCGSEKVLPSTRRSWWGGVQQSLGLRRFLCDDCYHRFTVRGGQDETQLPRVPEPLGAMHGQRLEDSSLPDGPVFLEPATPFSEARPEEPESNAPDREWRARTDSDSQPEPEPGLAPESASPARLRLQPEPEAEVWGEPGSGQDYAPSGHGLADLQPSLDFAGPGLEHELAPNQPARTSPPLLGLWRKVGLGLGLALICLALLLWYRLNLDSAPDSQTPTPTAAPAIQEQPTGLPPAAPPLGGGDLPRTEVGGPTVGAIMPPNPEPADQDGSAQPLREKASAATTPTPPAIPGPTPLPQTPSDAAPIAKAPSRVDQTPRPVRYGAAKEAPMRGAARAKSPTIAQAASGGYRLQFGAFSDPDRAMALASKLKGMGFKVDLVQGATGQGRTLTKVRSGHFANVREARKARIRAAALTAMDVVIVPPPRR